MLTNSYPHKNTLNALRAFAASRAAKNHIKLRVLGALGAGVLAQVARPGVQIEIHNHVDDATLTHWYRSCMFLFSPSLAEGYNLPISEAVTLGSNVLCSDIEVHREFFGRYANFFDPASVEDMTEALNKGFEILALGMRLWISARRVRTETLPPTTAGCLKISNSADSEERTYLNVKSALLHSPFTRGQPMIGVNQALNGLRRNHRNQRSL